MINSPDELLVTHHYGGSTTNRMRGDMHHGFTRREFIPIGDARLHSVMLTPLYDELLMEAVGQPVALSVVKQKRRLTVVAIRTPDAGVQKPGLVGALFGIGVGMFWALVGAAFFAGLVFIAVAVLTEVTIGIVAAVATAALLTLWTIRTLAGRLRARSALG